MEKSSRCEIRECDGSCYRSQDERVNIAQCEGKKSCRQMFVGRARISMACLLVRFVPTSLEYYPSRHYKYIWREEKTRPQSSFYPRARMFTAIHNDLDLFTVNRM